jgi:phosphoribosyl 1,2-cyclic phosphate phosphodiesterase
LREEPHFSHLNLEEALDLILKPEKYLTHISHHFGFHEEVQKAA